MTLVDPNVGLDADADREALIKEARRLRRRRWLFGLAMAALAVGAGLAGYLLASGSSGVSHHVAPPNHAGPFGSSALTRASAPTRSPDLIQPTTLAALPNGDVLILDSSRDQILELRTGGDLSVFAGDGRLGFAGDGGPARDAELGLTYFSDAAMTVRPDGTVQFLDDGNCRVRSISPHGIIRTTLRVPRVNVQPSGSACPVAGFAVSPAGDLYVAINSEIERVSSSNHLVRVAGAHGSGANARPYLTPSHVAFFPGALVFNNAGDLYIGNSSPKVIFQLTPTGKMTQLPGVSYADQLTLDPDAQILAGTHGGEIQEVTSTGIHPFYDVIPRRAGIDWGRDQGFQENGMAVTRNGTIYVDNSQGNGYGAGTVLVRISRAKHAALVPIRTSLTATLPRVGSPGFPVSEYPAARPARGAALSSCPSDNGLERFASKVIAQARRVARNYLSGQFASDITVTDRSWWTADFNDYQAGIDLGRHTVTGERPASKSPRAVGLAQACGSVLVNDSVAVTVGKSSYSDFTGTLYFLDRNGHPLVYDVR